MSPFFVCCLETKQPAHHGDMRAAYWLRMKIVGGIRSGSAGAAQVVDVGTQLTQPSPEIYIAQEQAVALDTLCTRFDAFEKKAIRVIAVASALPGIVAAVFAALRFFGHM